MHIDAGSNGRPCLASLFSVALLAIRLTRSPNFQEKLPQLIIKMRREKASVIGLFWMAMSVALAENGHQEFMKSPLQPFMSVRI
jgi:hypothetical protein